jgi:hypothetical protein
MSANPRSRVAELFASFRPEWTVQAISDRAGIPVRCLRSWVAPEETDPPAAPPPESVLLRLAVALGADFTAVRQAFTAAGSTAESGYRSHFAPGDRVLVFGAPDPANGRRRVRRGTVLDPPSPGVIGIAFEDGEHGQFSPADPVRVSHAAGACRCVTPIS